MSLCFNEFMRSFVNKFSNLKITHCISSPVLLNREAFLRTPRADSTSDLEGRSGTSSFKRSSSQPSSSSDSGEWSFWSCSRMSSSVLLEQLLCHHCIRRQYPQRKYLPTFILNSKFFNSNLFWNSNRTIKQMLRPVSIQRTLPSFLNNSLW